MRTTRYFEEQVRRKRPYISLAWCEDTLTRSLRVERQADGRLRFWLKIEESSTDRPRYLRVVTLDEGATVHNAFLDRDFREVPT